MSRPINPVFWLELRLRFHEKKFKLVTACFAAILAAITWFVVWVTGLNHRGPERVPGEAVIASDSVVLLGLILIIAGTAGAGRISQEREQRTLSGLLNTPQSAASIAWGKLLGCWAFVGWFLAIGFVFLAGGALLGGGSWAKVAASTAVCALAGMTASAVGLGISGSLRSTRSSYLATVLFLFFWIVVLPLMGVFFGFETVHLDQIGQWQHATWSQQLLLGFFFKNNPFTVLTVGLTGTAQMPKLFSPAQVWPPALLFWALLGWGGFALAVRGLKRGLFDRS